MARLIVREHRIRVGLALGGVRRRDGVDDGLGLFVANLCLFGQQRPRSGRASRAAERGRAGEKENKLTLIVVYDIAEVVLAAVVRSTHAHGVVREVDVAVVA